MRTIKIITALFGLVLASLPVNAFAAGGIFASGGGTKTVGDTFTVTVAASGATFDSFHGKISVTGPVSISSFSAGSATWITSPANNTTFDGALLGQKVSSFTIATIKLRATSTGSGAVTVSGAQLLSAGNIVGTSSGNASFTIQKAPDLPGAVSVTSSTHPDQNTAYETTTVTLNWNKDTGVDGFSYVLDQTDGTTPPATIKDANTTASFADQTVGVHYFHIRAHKTDGWGQTSHFKITIKEPDPKIDASLSAPKNITISKADVYTNDIAGGTVTGIIITGQTEPGYSVNLTFSPKFDLPAGKPLTAVADDNGNFTLTLDFPLRAGSYGLTIQGQKDKVLTPISEAIYFEISQVKGGAINILSDSDRFEPTVEAATTKKTQKWYREIHLSTRFLLISTLGLILIAGLVFSAIALIRRQNNKKIIRLITDK